MLAFNTLVIWHITWIHEAFKSTGDPWCYSLLLKMQLSFAISAKRCQELCQEANIFLGWTTIEANVVKCRSVAYHKRPTTEFNDPQLCLEGQTIPYLGDGEFYFLCLKLDSSSHFESSKSRFGATTNVVPNGGQLASQKCSRKWNPSNSLCLRLQWLLSSGISLTWVECQLEPIATRFVNSGVAFVTVLQLVVYI